MKIAEFIDIRWRGGELPLIEPPGLSPVIADPSFLFPYETADGLWVLYAHSAWGVCAYISSDGISWKYRGIKAANAMRPFVRKVSDQRYVLLYEKYRPLAMPLQILPGTRRWKSRIELRIGESPVSWGKAASVVLPEKEWMKDPKYGDSVSNPCLIYSRGKYMLFFSASLAFIDDCGFCEPKYIAFAQSDTFEGGYEIRPEPVISPETDPMPGVIGAGSIKVMEMEDGYVGLQNRIYRDNTGHSRSAIFILRSDDGIVWTSAKNTPLIAPDSGWKRSHVYACDCRFDEKAGRYIIYFNARDGWRISEGKERIGRLEG